MDKDPNLIVQREYLRRTEAAHFIGVSTPTFDRLVKAGTLPPPIEIARKLKRWKKTSLMEWLDYNKMSGQSKPVTRIDRASPEEEADMMEGNTDHDLEGFNDDPIFGGKL